MRNIFVRPALPKDASSFTDWITNTPLNLFDKDVMDYPSTITLCAAKEEGQIVYVPVQFPAVMESLAINPNADKLSVASAIAKIFDTVVTQCFVQGRGEIYFICKEESTIKFAESRGFEEIKHKVFRIKLNTFEK